MTQYFVTKRETCSECNGDGFLYQPAEMKKCRECGGSGIIQQEIALQEALRELGVLGKTDVLRALKEDGVC